MYYTVFITYINKSGVKIPKPIVIKKRTVQAQAPGCTARARCMRDDPRDLWSSM